MPRWEVLLYAFFSRLLSNLVSSLSDDHGQSKEATEVTNHEAYNSDNTNWIYNAELLPDPNKE